MLFCERLQGPWRGQTWGGGGAPREVVPATPSPPSPKKKKKRSMDVADYRAFVANHSHIVLLTIVCFLQRNVIKNDECLIVLCFVFVFSERGE